MKRLLCYDPHNRAESERKQESLLEKPNAIQD
jgi:hypothetical protein